VPKVREKVNSRAGEKKTRSFETRAFSATSRQPSLAE